MNLVASGSASIPVATGSASNLVTYRSTSIPVVRGATSNLVASDRRPSSDPPAPEGSSSARSDATARPSTSPDDSPRARHADEPRRRASPL